MRIADIFGSLLSFEAYKMRYNQLRIENPEMYTETNLEEKHWKGFIQFVLGGETIDGVFHYSIPAAGARTLCEPILNDLFPPLAHAVTQEYEQYKNEF